MRVHREVISQDGLRCWAEQMDGNDVLYARNPLTGQIGPPLWDKFSWEAGHGTAPPTPPPVRPPAPPADPPPPAGRGGIAEHASSLIVRPRLTRAQMTAFLPSEPGPFTFPGYGTRGIRLTNAQTGSVHPTGMAYWPQINHHAGLPDLFVLLSINGRLHVLDVNKATGAVMMLMALPFTGTGEGCYWSLAQPHLLYVPQGRSLVVYDIVNNNGGDAFKAYDDIRQVHTSDDGQVHSCTIGGSAAVARNGEIQMFPSAHEYDECQIDKSGRWLLIKEGEGDNRIIDLETEQEWTITNKAGAVGHSDIGWGDVVGEEDQTDPGGVFRRWIFTPDGPLDAGIVYHMDWTAMTRYISRCNALNSDIAPQVALVSSAHDGEVARANELVEVRLDGSLTCRVLCPNLNDLNAEDGYGANNKYWRKTRANICPAGEWALFTGNCGTDRVDAFLVELP